MDYLDLRGKTTDRTLSLDLLIPLGRTKIVVGLVAVVLGALVFSHGYERVDFTQLGLPTLHVMRHLQHCARSRSGVQLALKVKSVAFEALLRRVWRLISLCIQALGV